MVEWMIVAPGTEGRSRSTNHQARRAQTDDGLFPSFQHQPCNAFLPANSSLVERRLVDHGFLHSFNIIFHIIFLLTIISNLVFVKSLHGTLYIFCPGLWHETNSYPSGKPRGNVWLVFCGQHSSSHESWSTVSSSSLFRDFSNLSPFLCIINEITSSLISFCHFVTNDHTDLEEERTLIHEN